MSTFPWTMTLSALGIMAIVMFGLWLLQRRTNNAGYVDVGWSFGIGLVAVGFAIGVDGYLPRRILVAALVLTWSLRLGWHILQRVRQEDEDGRYRELRESFDDETKRQWFFFGFYEFQALLVVLFALAPMIAMSRNAAALDWIDALGVAIWLIAILGETIADKQLQKFKEDPDSKGKVCKRGLWRYTRHPNYFFEWVHWFAYCAIAWATPFFWLTWLVGPGLMFIFLRFVTGVPPTERNSVKSRGEAYRAYQRSTNAFFPWFPQNQATTS